MNFRNDLKFGQIYEREFIKVMGLKSYEIDHATNKAIKEYDIIVNHNGSDVLKRREWPNRQLTKV